MRLWSEAWHNGEALPLRFASGQLHTDGRLAPGPNLNPPLLWADLPPGSQSLALLCHDFDALEAANRCTAAATDANCRAAAASSASRRRPATTPASTSPAPGTDRV